MIDDHDHFLAMHGYQGERPAEMAADDDERGSQQQLDLALCGASAAIVVVLLALALWVVS